MASIDLNPTNLKPLTAAAPPPENRTEAAPAAPLPAWVPQPLDLTRLTGGIYRILRDQHMPLSSFVPGRVKHLLITDADHTLLRTKTPIFVRKNGKLLRDADNKIVVLGLKTADFVKEFNELKQKYPGVELELDFTEYASIAAVLSADEIPSTLRELRTTDLGGDDKREFVITARSPETAVIALLEYLANRRVGVDGVFAANSSAQTERLGLGGSKLNTAQRKALIMVGLLKLYGFDKTTGTSVKFIDDTDTNLIAAMQLLPKLFPKTRFEFADVVHVGHGQFEQRLVGQTTGKDATVRAANGTPLTEQEIAAYHSDDVPLDALRSGTTAR